MYMYESVKYKKELKENVNNRNNCFPVSGVSGSQESFIIFFPATYFMGGKKW